LYEEENDSTDYDSNTIGFAVNTAVFRLYAEIPAI
jgi:hypothetical protein